MDIERFLNLAAEIETQISEIYQKVATLAVDEATAKQLLKISHEEINHANSLKTGKCYLKQAPELFMSVNMSEDELNAGLADIASIQSKLQGKILLLPALKWLLDLEKRFEIVHIGASVLIADIQLKQLFQALSKGDQNHIAKLTGMISGSEGK